MRTKTLIPGMRNSDTVRILFSDSGIAVYMTVKQALEGFGRVSQAIAVEKALRALGNARLDPGIAGAATVGLAGTWEGLNVQVNYTV
jgi:hypothetical protein